MPKKARTYKRLEDAQQSSIIEQRLVQFEGEHFNHSLNLQLLEAQKAGLAASDEEGRAAIDAEIKRTEQAMATIESAIDTLEAEATARKKK